jgi:hypothetical protein
MQDLGCINKYTIPVTSSFVECGRLDGRGEDVMSVSAAR